MFKKTLIALLAVCAAVSLASCDKTNNTVKPDTNVENPNSDTTDASDADGVTEIDYESGLSDERFDGYNFRILIRPGKIVDEYLPEDSDDPVESAVYRRNKAVEDRFGITITATESSSSDWEVDAINSVLAGDDAYDIIFPHTRAAFVYANQGAAYNINDISSIHLEKPWWSQDVRNSFNINNHLYILDGDISTHRLSQAFCLVFNKRIFDELGLAYPYKMVKDGDWTFDNFAYLVKKGAADLNGDGVLKYEDDQFGYYATDWHGSIAILYTTGAKVYDKDEEGNLQLTLYSNKVVSAFDDYFALVRNNACIFSCAQFRQYDSFFNSGRLMFCDAGLDSVRGLRNMDDDFGVLPYPKYTEDDEYATAVNAHAHVGIIPITVSDVERTGAIIEALCAYGSRDVIPAYYDVTLKTKHSRDTESEEMLDIIKDSIIYDIGYSAGSGFGSVGHDLANSENRDFASYYAAGVDAAKESLKAFNEAYGGIVYED